MEQRLLGRAAFNVPVVGMGTWKTFDVASGELPSRRRIVDRALDAGIRLFDSSPMYGRAEAVLSETLRDRRGDALVATKIWARSAAEGREQARHALDLFGERIDLYQIHNLVNWREHLEMLESLRDRGEVVAIGVTHYSAARFDDLMEVMRTGRIDAIQVPYNPNERDVERAVLPLAADLGIGVVVMRPFGEGSLLRRLPREDALGRLKSFGIQSWTEALIKWILSDHRCHVTIPATSSEAHVVSNASAGSPPWFGEEERRYVVKMFGV